MPPARLLIVTLLLAILSARASAGASQCARYATELGVDSDCHCGPSLLPAYPLSLDDDSGSAPGPSLVLVAACGYARQNDELIGSFLLKGKLRARGTISVTYSETFGERITFDSATPLPGTSPFFMDSMQLDYHKILSRLRLPSAETEDECWFAPARLDLLRVAVVVDGGTDSAGTFATRFSNVRVGKFKKCDEN